MTPLNHMTALQLLNELERLNAALDGMEAKVLAPVDQVRGLPIDSLRTVVESTGRHLSQVTKAVTM